MVLPHHIPAVGGAPSHPVTPRCEEGVESCECFKRSELQPKVKHVTGTFFCFYCGVLNSDLDQLLSVRNPSGAHHRGSIWLPCWMRSRPESEADPSLSLWGKRPENPESFCFWESVGSLWKRKWKLQEFVYESELKMHIRNLSLFTPCLSQRSMFLQSKNLASCTFYTSEFQSFPQSGPFRSF